MSQRRLGAVVAIAAVAAMIGYLFMQRDVLDAIREVSIWTGAALVMASCGALAVQAEQYRVAVRIHAVKIAVRESIALTAVNAMANYYLPARGGVVVRAAYMKRVYGFPLAHYAVLAVMITGLTILVATMLGVVGVVAVAIVAGPMDWGALSVFVGIAGAVVLGVGAAIALTRVLGRGSRWADTIESFWSGMTMWFQERRRFGVFLLWTLGFFAASAGRLWLSFHAVGASVGFFGIVVVQAMAWVAFVLALTPGSLGVREAAVVFTAGLLGVSTELALLAALVDRAATLVVTFGMSLVSVRYLSERTATGQASGQGPGDESLSADPVEQTRDDI